jgi:UDP-N-acetylmuramoylalanine--D-glutamate ligase
MINLINEKVDVMILIGEASERFALAANAAGFFNIRFADTFESAVNIAHNIASPPQIVLLSPACASYDMFDNYEQRGRQFKELVHRLAH